MKFKVTVELEHVSGPEQDEETMLDYFAGTIGKENGAKPPIYLSVGLQEDLETPESVYLVKLIDA